MGGVLGHAAQQAADALADVGLRVVQPREQLGDDTWGQNTAGHQPQGATLATAGDIYTQQDSEG